MPIALSGEGNRVEVKTLSSMGRMHTATQFCGSMSVRHLQVLERWQLVEQEAAGRKRCHEQAGRRVIVRRRQCGVILPEVVLVYQ